LFPARSGFGAGELFQQGSVASIFSSLIDFFPYWGLIGFDFGFRVLSTAQASIKLACEKTSRQPFFGEFLNC
jgi:hypothetical protein